MPLNPNEVLAPVAIAPLYAAFFAVTCAPLCEVVAFHAWVDGLARAERPREGPAVDRVAQVGDLDVGAEPGCHWLVIV